MADLKYYDIIQKPLMTEKSMRFVEQGRETNSQGDEMRTDKGADPVYMFYVHPKATKGQIKEAVEKLFAGTRVESVNTMLTHPKKRQRRGFLPGKSVIRKKAIVKLTPGSSQIEYFEGI